MFALTGNCVRTGHGAAGQLGGGDIVIESELGRGTTAVWVVGKGHVAATKLARRTVSSAAKQQVKLVS